MNPPHATSPGHISEVRLRSDVARTLGGSGLLLVLIHPSAPVILIRKSRDSRENLVPVLFAAGSLPSLADLHRISDGMIMLTHNVAASKGSTFLLAPFLFNRFDDPRRFCAVLVRQPSNLSRAIASLAPERHSSKQHCQIFSGRPSAARSFDLMAR